MWEKLKRYFLYAELTKEQYGKVVPLVAQENYRTLTFACIVQAIYFGISFISSFGYDQMADKKMVYEHGMIVPLIILALHLLFSRKYSRVQDWLLRFFTLGLMATGLLCTLVCDPEEMTILLLIFFFCVNMLFIHPPLDMVIIISFTDIVYFIFAPGMKHTKVLSLDMVDIALFSTLSLILGLHIMHGRFRRYWLETEALELADLRYRAAYHDMLTGLYNRTSYEHAVTEIDKNPIPEDLMYIALDVNSLKIVNDTLGHAAGDELIVGTARCLELCMADYGEVFRIGGDEFAAILYVKDVNPGELLQKFNERVESWRGKLVDHMSVSYGYVLGSEAEQKSIREIALVADKRMYQAKSNYYKNTGISRRGFDVKRA